MRLKTRDYELIVGQSGNYTLVVVQVPAVAAQPVGSTSSKKSEVQQQQTQVAAK